MKIYLKILLFSFFTLLTSCVKDIDFSQAKNLELTPAVTFPMSKFKFEQVDLIDNITNKELLIFSDTATFLGFNGIQHKEYLDKAKLFFEVENEFSRTFELNFSLLDANGATTYSMNTFIVKPENTYKTTEEIIIADHPNFLNSTKIAITIKLIPDASSPINVNIPKKLIFKSSGTFYLRIN